MSFANSLAFDFAANERILFPSIKSSAEHGTFSSSEIKIASPSIFERKSSASRKETLEYLEEKGYTTSKEEFLKYMEEQKKLSKSN